MEILSKALNFSRAHTEVNDKDVDEGLLVVKAGYKRSIVVYTYV